MGTSPESSAAKTGLPPHPFDKRWYTHVRGKTYGPYTGHEIRELVDQHKILATDFVYGEGGNSWTQIANDPVLQSLLGKPDEKTGWWRRSASEKDLSSRRLKIILALVLATITSWIVWPYYAVYDLATAFQEGDVSTLESRVAWESVRQGLRDDLNAVLLQKLKTNTNTKTNEPGAALGAGLAAVLGPAIIDRMIDSYVTPQAIATSNRVEQTNSSSEAIGSPPKKFEETVQSARRVRWDQVKYAFFSGSPFTFKLEVVPEHDPPFKNPITLLFRWDGNWRLRRILLPADVFEVVADTAAAGRKHSDALATRMQSAEPNIQTADSNKEDALFKKKQEYLKNLQVYDFKARYYKSLLDGRIPGVEFKIKNNGQETLDMVKVTVYFKDAQGKTIAEEHYTPVLVSDFSLSNNTPLKPNYIWQLEHGKFYAAKSVPSEWKEGAAEIQITDIQFAGESKH
jgi:Protein of unknown function (DUF2939)/GYF domain 2